MINDKKAVSEVVAYVMLIVIALSISAMVFVWLKYYVPKDTEECPDSAAIAIANYSCNTAEKTISLSLQNSGLFNISGFSIYASNASGELPMLEMRFVSSSKPLGYLPEGNYISLESPLPPGESLSLAFDYKEHNTLKEIEIEPFRAKNVICKNAIIRQRLEGCA